MQNELKTCLSVQHLLDVHNRSTRYLILSMPSQHRRLLKLWARTVGMPIGITDEDKPEFLPITQEDVRKALFFRTFWIVLHILTCFAIIAGNGRVLGFW